MMPLEIHSHGQVCSACLAPIYHSNTGLMLHHGNSPEDCPPWAVNQAWPVFLRELC